MKTNRHDCIALMDEVALVMRQRNLDSSEKVSMSFYIEHDSDAQARALALALYDEGFETDIDAFQQHLNKWRCWACIDMIPNRHNLHRVLSALIEKSHCHQGNIAGCEVSECESNEQLGQMMAQFEAVYHDAI